MPDICSIAFAPFTEITHRGWVVVRDRFGMSFAIVCLFQGFARLIPSLIPSPFLVFSGTLEPLPEAGAQLFNLTLPIWSLAHDRRRHFSWYSSCSTDLQGLFPVRPSFCSANG